MAYISEDKWRTDKVVDWLKGLDESMYGYINSFTQEGVVGSDLLNIRAYELEKLGMHFIGHQEIVLDAVENLRNIHHNLDTENLQFLALHVATAARSLHRQLSTYCNDTSVIETQILNDISYTVATIKPLIGWLNRVPFKGQEQFTEVCMKMLRLGLEMATIAQRDRFVEQPVEQIKKTAKILECLANYIIQDITDPLILQPASLCLVTLKKRESDIGFNIESNQHGVHRITDVKHNSPAHTSGKIEDGDEIVQINYQTVVGWQHKSVIKNLSESPPDVLLTLKKRPKHTKIYGQVYMQPYRLPSKKRTIGARWGASDSVPSPSQPRVDLLNVPNVDNQCAFNMPVVVENNKNTLRNLPDASSDESDSSCSELMTPTDIKADAKEKRLFYPKPRTMLQRRNTIAGDELFGRIFQATGLPPAWLDREKVGGANCDPASPSLRDKSKSFGFGLELTPPRPTTCIGLAEATSTSTQNTLTMEDGAANSDVCITKSALTKRSDLNATTTKDSSDKFKPGVSKVVRFDANMKIEDYTVDEKYTCNVENTILETFAPIPYADEDDEGNGDDYGANADEVLETLNCESEFSIVCSTVSDIDKRSSVPLAEAVNLPVVVHLRRGRLDKSHSTPAYDNSGEESDTPPAIEPRKLVPTPPVPPPRPKKHTPTTTNVPTPPPKPLSMQQKQQISCLVQSSSTPPPVPTPTLSASTQNIKYGLKTTTPITKTQAAAPQQPPPPPTEVCELNTPTRTRTLTLRKKHTLVKRRRNVNLKLLGSSSDISISSHLFRRTKDHRGVTYWARLYFVMLDTILYGFRSKEAVKASSLIFLPGFTVSPAKEVHSKPYAFKVYHAEKTFYFAAESQDALNQWVDFIRVATIQNYNLNSIVADQDVNPKDLYSETDSSGEENETLIAKNLSTPSPQGSNDVAACMASSTSSSAQATTPTASLSVTTPTTTNTKQDRRYLGSLRKLTKGSLNFKSSSNANKSTSSDIPVPTEQYRCYRKVPGGSFGIQIGTSTAGYPPAVLPPSQDNLVQILFNNNANSKLASNSQESNNNNTGLEQQMNRLLRVESPPPPILAPKPVQVLATAPKPPAAIPSTILNTSNESPPLGPPSFPAPTLAADFKTTTIISSPTRSSSSRNDSFESPSKGSKKMPYNFIHASNPNLLEIDFQTSKALDYSLPKINPADSWDAHKTPHGFVTLKDLMLQKQEEEAQEMYNNRVLLGVEKKSKKDNERRRTAENVANGGSTSQQQQQQQQQQQLSNTNALKTANRNKLSSRSLPKTPDYEISFKPDDENIKRTRTKEGLKLRDFGYELISGDEPIVNSTAVHETTNKLTTGTTTSRQNSNTSNHSSSSNYEQQQHHQQDHSWSARHFLTSVGHKNKKHSSNSCCSSISSNTDFSEKRTGGGGSFKKKGKFEAIKSSSERLFQFTNKHTTSTTTNNSGGGGPMLTMTLPLNKKSNHHHHHQHVLDENVIGGCVSGGIKKSRTYNNDLKDKASGVNANAGKYDAHRKNSAPIFSKLTTSYSSNKIAKEKRLLGSPLLHRTLFGNNSSHQQQQQKHQSSTNIFATSQQQQNNTTTSNSTSTSTLNYGGREYDQEIFSQVTFSKVPSCYYGSGENGRHTHTRRQSSSSHNTQEAAVAAAAATIATSAGGSCGGYTSATNTPTQTPIKTPATTPEYPHMECPPVFEPEIYSLSEPNASLSLLLRRNNSSGGSGVGGSIINSNEDAKQ